MIKVIKKQKKDSTCCGYGLSGTGSKGGDCLLIPGALSVKNTSKQGFSRLCGRSMGLGSMSNAASTVCSDRTPFNVRFLSDNFEFTNGMEVKAGMLNTGFRLAYIQSSNNC